MRRQHCHQGGRWIHLPERKTAFGGASGEQGRVPPQPLIPVRCSPTSPHSLPWFSLHLLSVFLMLIVPACVSSISVAMSVSCLLSFWVSLSLYDLLPEGCPPMLLSPPINGEPLPMCPCVNWGYVCRHTCVLGHVCGHVCMSEVTCVRAGVCECVLESRSQCGDT